MKARSFSANGAAAFARAGQRRLTCCSPSCRRASAVPASGTYEGRPYGDVCIYPNASWNGGHPQSSQGEFFTSAATTWSTSSGSIGSSTTQYGGATVTLYYGSGCTDSYFTIDQYTYSDVNLFIPSLALLLGTATRTHRTFQALYVILWYAAVNQVAAADYMGTVLAAGRPAGPSALSVAGAGAAMLAVTFAIRVARHATR